MYKALRQIKIYYFKANCQNQSLVSKWSNSIRNVIDFFIARSAPYRPITYISKKATSNNT